MLDPPRVDAVQAERHRDSRAGLKQMFQQVQIVNRSGFRADSHQFEAVLLADAGDLLLDLPGTGRRVGHGPDGVQGLALIVNEAGRKSFQSDVDTDVQGLWHYCSPPFGKPKVADRPKARSPAEGSERSLVYEQSSQADGYTRLRVRPSAAAVTGVDPGPPQRMVSIRDCQGEGNVLRKAVELQGAAEVNLAVPVCRREQHTGTSPKNREQNARCRMPASCGSRWESGRSPRWPAWPLSGASCDQHVQPQPIRDACAGRGRSPH